MFGEVRFRDEPFPIVCGIRNLDAIQAELILDFLGFDAVLHRRLAGPQQERADQYVEDGGHEEHPAPNQQRIDDVKALIISLQIDDVEFVNNLQEFVDGVALVSDNELSELPDFEQRRQQRDLKHLERRPGIEDFRPPEHLLLLGNRHRVHPEDQEYDQIDRGHPVPEQEIAKLCEANPEGVRVFSFLRELDA